MAAGIPPPPLNSPSGSYYWLEWYTQLTNILNGTGYPWTALNFSSSNLHDIQVRHHNSLQNVQGGNAAGDVNGGGNAWHMTGRGYVDASGAGTGLPAGWTVSNTGTGLYTITHNLGLVAPNIGGIATSATTGVVVQWIDCSSSAVAVVHTTNPSGTATNGAFTFVISS
jgi:hypothetical protein